MNDIKSEISSPKDLEKIEIDLFLQGIFEWYGYDYRDYAYHSIKRRIWHRIHAERLNSVLELLDKVLHNPDCMQRLTEDFSINVTEMFRDPLFFLEFRKKVIPILRTYPSIRIWHAGCSTGEEVYSMAILLQEEGLYDKTKIYATDINTNVLRIAKNGIFSISNMKRYTNNYLEAGGTRSFSEYYKVTNDKVKFDPSLSKNVVFAQHNLVTDRSFNEFHVILCRNVLIYFNRNLQAKVHQLFYESLGMFGILGLGDKETISFTNKADYYKELSRQQKIYQKIK
ncbi:protein-glutamate O-methyltransferase CheR [Sporosarcina thermotolerans]|uniref:Protein-glutamate O-methyltransferase CheR n=1 Tax=Sporosarcina thermotolerans TaxID=633404 RepID=A0AAW9A750_9BACL|nr:protein-glutamate O-methyltransferase CheR [Sporosarcina thermotolerans]MDW0117197.1 protein-glutamate O-methyltransferase CheR [Sporosarcina thermotolerans]WHT47368.1 protein-glutamate O-methyltransferase CheR [Sporosarcina thermotolerans]